LGLLRSGLLRTGQIRGALKKVIFTFVKINLLNVEDPAGGTGVAVAVNQNFGRQLFVEIRRIQTVGVADCDVLSADGVPSRPEQKVDVVLNVTRRSRIASADQEDSLV